MRYRLNGKRIDTYGVRDEKDGITEFYSASQLKVFIDKGIPIEGVSFKSDTKFKRPKELDNMDLFIAKQRFSGKDVIIFKPDYNLDACKAAIKNRASDDIVVINQTNLQSLSGLFANVRLNSLDLSYFDSTNVIDMSWLFNHTVINNIIFGSFDTSRVITMFNMFSNCHTDVLDLSCFNTQNVIDMSHMFSESGINCLNVRSFDTSKTKYFISAFEHCRTPVLDLHTFETEKAADFSYMFNRCESEIVDLSNMKLRATSEVLIPNALMNGMFNSCKFTFMDLSDIDILSVKTREDSSKLFNMCEGNVSKLDDRLVRLYKEQIIL